MRTEIWFINYLDYKNNEKTIKKEYCIENIKKLLKKCINLSKAKNTDIKLIRLKTLKTYKLDEIKKWYEKLEKQENKNEKLD